MKKFSKQWYRWQNLNLLLRLLDSEKHAEEIADFIAKDYIVDCGDRYQLNHEYEEDTKLHKALIVDIIDLLTHGYRD